jgi:hypothetical protein
MAPEFILEQLVQGLFLELTKILSRPFIPCVAFNFFVCSGLLASTTTKALDDHCYCTSTFHFSSVRTYTILGLHIFPSGVSRCQVCRKQSNFGAPVTAGNIILSIAV